MAESTRTPLVLAAAAALVDRDGRILLTQRPPGKSLAGLWEFPGGKVEAGETPETALIRELREELAIDVQRSCLAPLSFVSHPYDDFHLLMPLYACRLWKGTPRACEGGPSLGRTSPVAGLADPPRQSVVAGAITGSAVTIAPAERPDLRVGERFHDGNGTGTGWHRPRTSKQTSTHARSWRHEGPRKPRKAHVTSRRNSGHVSSGLMEPLVVSDSRRHGAEPSDLLLALAPAAFKSSHRMGFRLSSLTSSAP